MFGRIVLNKIVWIQGGKLQNEHKLIKKIISTSVFYLKSQAVPRSKHIPSGHKNQSVNGV